MGRSDKIVDLWNFTYSQTHFSKEKKKRNTILQILFHASQGAICKVTSKSRKVSNFTKRIREDCSIAGIFFIKNF